MYQQPFDEEMDSLVSGFRTKICPTHIKFPKAPKFDFEFLPKFDAVIKH